MKKVKADSPEIPELDLGMEADQALGTVVADAKIAAMKRGFDVRYQDGVTEFFKQQCGGDLESDRHLGERIAQAKLEERRQTLLAIAIKSGIFTAMSGIAAVVVGFSPVQAAIVVFPSTVAAICTSKK